MVTQVATALFNKSPTSCQSARALAVRSSVAGVISERGRITLSSRPWMLRCSGSPAADAVQQRDSTLWAQYYRTSEMQRALEARQCDIANWIDVICAEGGKLAVIVNPAVLVVGQL